MTRSVLTAAAVFLCVGAMAQSKDFMQVYDACNYARKAMSGGQGSNGEIGQAGSLLNSAKWNYLHLFKMKGETEAEFGETTMVFTPEYLKQFSENRSLVYQRARMYAEEAAAAERDPGNVKLCTKCIGAKSSVTYTMRLQGNTNTLDVAAVSEVNGLINLYVVIEDGNGNRSEPYKEKKDEFKGASSRRLHIEDVPSGDNTVYITIENKYDSIRSVAVIVE